ncbi:hypothetical protein ACQ4PT_001324 [Festuca glaucescens]
MEVEDMKITTVEEIWQCKGSLLCSDPETERGLRLKDVCLSMALSKMLHRRFAGFELVEANLQKTKDFVFQGLLVGDKASKRVFRVIEVELGFVYDLYFTRYPYLYKGWYLALCLPFVMVILCSWLTYQLFKACKKPANNGNNFPLNTTLTLGVMLAVTFLEAFQLYLHMASGWFKVALIRSYTVITNTGNDDPRLVVQGAWLARQLTEEIQDKKLQWRVLVDFWAEMILYVAPCDDALARAHLEALTKGGEFITHLWALLTHAGVLERDHVGPMAAV